MLVDQSAEYIDLPTTVAPATIAGAPDRMTVELLKTLLASDGVGAGVVTLAWVWRLLASSRCVTNAPRRHVIEHAKITNRPSEVDLSRISTICAV
jgi:hypothetical protein